MRLKGQERECEERQGGKGRRDELSHVVDDEPLAESDGEGREGDGGKGVVGGSHGEAGEEAGGGEAEEVGRAKEGWGVHFYCWN